MKTKGFVTSTKLALFFCILAIATGTARANYTLTLTAQGSGSIAANPTNASYPSGVTVTVTATPNAGWYFANWSGDASGSANPLNVVMNANLAITGTFLELPVYTLALATNGEGAIALNPAGGSYASNSTVTATATPAAGWVFAGWSGGTNTVTNPVSLTLDTNSSLTGTFAELPAITTQPVSVTNAPGSTVSFSAQVAGTAPLVSQWFFSGGPLAGATSPLLTLTDVSTLQAGTYWMVATNDYGSVTSTVVSLVLTNTGGATNVVISPNEASLVAAISQGGWVGLGFNGTVPLTNTIAITNAVILDGHGVAVTLSGGGAVQLFSVAPGASLSITNLTLANGFINGSSAAGGAISNNAGTVTLVGCLLTNNIVQGANDNGMASGGAIYNENGSLCLYNSSFSSNSATPGAPYGYGVATAGGAIYNSNGTVTVVGCDFSGNLVQGLGGGLTCYGGAIFQMSGSLLLINNTFASNQSLGGNQFGEFEGGSPTSGYGGALGINGGNVTADQCQFVNNLAQSGMGDAGSGDALGGAIYSTATLIIESNTFAGNQALASVSPIHGADGQGGAIYNDGLAEINHSALYSNSAQGSAAGAYATENDNGGDGLGGAIFNASLLYATNCTIALNSALAGSGIFETESYPPYTTNGAAIGGGLYNSLNATSILMNVTIASNYCVISGPAYQGTNGFAAGVEIANTNGVLHLHNSLIAYGGTNGNAYGPILDDGFNISSDGSAAFTSGSSYNNTDPQLGPLASYGTTWCMALLSGSPAIDNADPNDFPSTDQRGYFRPVGAGPDIGAYEYGSYAPGSIPSLAIATSAVNATVSFSAIPPGLYYLQSSTNLFNWVNVSTNGPFTEQTNIIQNTSMQGLNQLYFRVLLETNF